MLARFIDGLRLLTVLAGGHRTLALENLALRQQLAMYMRTRRRPATRWSDRLFWLGLRRVWSDWSGALVILRPATVIGWHRRGFAWYWSRQSGAIGGRPRLGHELRRLVRDRANANPLWGAPRIHGELMKLGLAVSERTISRLMFRGRRPPSQTWRTFLQNRVGSLVAIDFFTVPTITDRLLFVLVVLAHDRRRILHVNVTPTPTSAWTRQQLREAFPWEVPPRFVLHDRDTIFDAAFGRAVSGLGLTAVRTAPRSPWQNPYVRARHRLASPRVPGSRRRAQRTAFAATPPRLPRVLPPVADASRARQGHARHTSGRRRRRGPGRGAPRGRRAASSLGAPRRCVALSLDIKRVDTTQRGLAVLSADTRAGRSDRPSPTRRSRNSGRTSADATACLLAGRSRQGSAASQGLARDSDRFCERLRISSWCLTSTDSATTARAPPGPASSATVASRCRRRTARSRPGRF